MTRKCKNGKSRNGNGNGVSDVTKFVRWVGGAIGVIILCLTSFSGFMWYVIDSKIEPIVQSQIRVETQLLTINTWQKQKGEEFAADKAEKKQILKDIERRVDNLEHPR